MIGGRGAPPGRAAAAGPSSSAEISDISTKSRSKIFFMILVDTVADGLNGPGLASIELAPPLLGKLAGNPLDPFPAIAVDADMPRSAPGMPPSIIGTESGSDPA